MQQQVTGERHGDGEKGHHGIAIPGQYRLLKALRYVAAGLIVLVLAAAMSAAGLYFLLRGEAIENSTLSKHIEAQVREIAGGDYIIDLGRTTIGFDRDGFLSVAGTDVQIMQTNDRRPVSRLGRVVVGLKPWSVLSGAPRIDAIIIEDSILDGRLIASAMQGQPAEGMAGLLRSIGAQLNGVKNQFVEEQFRLFQLRNVHVNGLDMGRREPGSILVSDLELRLRRSNRLQLDAKLQSTHSQIELSGTFRRDGDGSSAFEMQASGINLRDWTWDLAGETGPVGTHMVFDVDANMAFGADGAPLEPTIRVASSGHRLRLGRTAITRIDDLRLNLRLLPDRSQIEIDPSVLVAGGFKAQLVGGLRPASDAGYSGPLEFELIADPASGTPTIVGERAVVAGMKFAGHILPDERRVNFDELLAIYGRDQIVGSASVKFDGATPSIAAAAHSAKFPVHAAKQLWPYWIAPPARKWVFANVVGGTLSDISLTAGIPPGVVGRFRRGAKMKPDEFELTARFDDMRLDTFGELPAIRGASGSWTLKGMRLSAELENGQTYDNAGTAVKVSKASFVIEDFAERPARAETNISVEGDARSLAVISQSEPLRVFERLELDPEKVSGSAHADVVARFPLKRSANLSDVAWNAIVELKDGASSEQIFGRRVEKADLVIAVDRESARITGDAVVDGTRTNLSLVEPLGESNVARQRNVNVTLDAEGRRRLGFSVDTVIDGPVEVSIEDGGADVLHTLDLQEAELSLPWIGWKKGKGIPATVTMRVDEGDGVTKLEDFYLEGPSFSAAGSMVLDKKGLLSADFANISLNEGDVFALKLSRKDKTFTITVDGTRMDARGLVNKLFHESGIGDEQGDTSVKLTANLGSVRGFGGRVLSNVTMSYGTQAGWFDSLSLRGAFNDVNYVSVFASTIDRRTTFQIDSNDAGGALAFVDVYRRVEGGNLKARLVREAGGAFTGPVLATNFDVIDEPRLQNLVGDPQRTHRSQELDFDEVRRRLNEVNTNRVRFIEARARIDKGEEYFRVKDATLTATQIGLIFNGVLFDERNHMDLNGTFLPALGISRAIGAIPLVSSLLGNGRDTGLIGITFRLSGPARNPLLVINPISAVAPGEFRKVFEFRE